MIYCAKCGKPLVGTGLSCTACPTADPRADLATANAAIRDLEANLSALKQRVAEVLEPFVCFEEQGRQLLADARQEDDKSASRLFNSWNFRPFPTWGHFRRAAELHASLRSSEGHPTEEGRRVSSENPKTQERK